MAEPTQKSELTIWGIPVPVTANGTRLWPDPLKKLAVDKIAAGYTFTEIGAEIGAKPALVWRWAKMMGPEPDQSDFVELRRETSRPAKPASPRQSAVCRIDLDGAAIEIPVGFPEMELTGILRAVRSSK